MLVIDKSQPNTRFIVTLTDVNPITSGSTINLFNLATNVDTTYDLPFDGSLYPNRYNQFDFSTSTFSALTEGYYTYAINDVSGGTTELGMLKVDDIVQSIEEDIKAVYFIPTGSTTQDDYIVYQPK